MADSDKLSLDLDEIIRNDRPNNRRGAGGNNRGFRGRMGRGGGGNAFRTRGGGGMPRTTNAPAAGRWKHDLYENAGNANRGGAQRSTGVNSAAKLLISNLDFGVTTADIEELFEDIGAVRTARVHFDENGRSLGTAEVIYERRADAVAAQRKYNSLNLDGRPMNIQLVGGVDDGSKPQFNRSFQANGNGGRNRNNNQQNGFRGNQSRGGAGRQQQNGKGNKKEEKISADDLDADLDAYRAESKQKST